MFFLGLTAFIFFGLVGAGVKTWLSFDTVMVTCYSAYFIHNYFSAQVSEGNVQYFWTIILTLLVYIIYKLLYNAILIRFPIIGMAINYIFAFLGSIFFMLVIGMLLNNRTSLGLPFLIKDNEPLSNMISVIMIALIAIPVSVYRLQKNFETFETTENDN